MVSVFTSAFVVYDVCWLITVSCVISWLAFDSRPRVVAL